MKSNSWELENTLETKKRGGYVLSVGFYCAHWATFFTAAILLNLSPGPDIAFILDQTVKRGTQSGFSAMFGIWTGAFIHIVFAALGLSAILATSAVAFSAVKWIGAVKRIQYIC